MMEIDERQFHRQYARRAISVYGRGPFAVLAHCQDLTIERFPPLEQAAKAKQTIDECGCGHCCSKAIHRLVRVRAQAVHCTL
jgi:hypothetical protein